MATYEIRAAGPGMAQVSILRAGDEMSDPRDPKNHLSLTEKQEAAYVVALECVKVSNPDLAVSVLELFFDKAWKRML